MEKRRYPQYDHIAVLIAEDITSRFLNIISLFNGVIPLVAIKMSLVQIQNQFTLIFTTVLDQRVGFSTADEEAQEVTDRAYWEKKGTKFTVAMADELVELLKKIDPEIEPKYNKFYIGLARNAKPFNFVIFRPKKQAIRVELRLQKSDEIEEKLENAGVEVMEYSSRDRRYRIRLSKGDITKHQALLNELFMLSYKEFSGNPDD